MRNISRTIAAAGFAVAVATFPTGASAQSTSPFYVGFGAGAAFPDDLSITAAGNFVGIPFSVDADIDLDTAFSAAATVGYHINSYIAVEGEFDYANFAIAAFDGSISLGGAVLNGRVSAEGALENFMGFANVIIAPWGEAKFSPYVGGGIGVASTRFRSIRSSPPGLGPVQIGSTDTETNLAAQAIIGFDYACNEWLDVGARYKFVWIDTVRRRPLPGRSAAEQPRSATSPPTR